MIVSWLSALLMAANAQAAAYVAQDAIAAHVNTTAVAVQHADDEAVYANGRALQDVIDGAAVRYAPSLHEVQRPTPARKEVDVKDMLDDARSRLTASKTTPSADLRANVRSQYDLLEQGRLKFDDSLDDSEMGVYRFMKERVHDGAVALNYWLKEMGLIVPVEFLEATNIHEVAHQRNAALAQEGVIDGEVVSFLAQYEWLTFVDPTGEKLALLRLALQGQMNKFPNALTQKALAYAATLDVLVGTGGDREKIKNFARELGYRDGQHGYQPTTPSA